MSGNSDSKTTSDASLRTASNTAADTSSNTGMHGWRLALVFLGLALGMFVSALSETIAATALPTIVGDLGGVEIMQWISTTYILTSTVVMPIYGKLGDLYGRKRLLVAALCLYAAGKAVCGLATNMGWLIVGRAISGLGGGGLIILSQAILADVVSARERGKYLGLAGAIFAMAIALGPVLGGWFVEVTGWRMIFWFTIPMALLAALATGIFLVRDVKGDVHTKPDVGGMVTATIFVVTLVLAMSWGGDTYAWDSWQIIGLFVACLVGAVGFVISEKRAPQPIIPLSLLKNRNFVLCTVAGMLVYAGFDGAINYLPTFLQIVEGESPEIAGLSMVPIVIGSFLTSTATGFIASHTGRYKWMPIAMCGVTAIGFFLISRLAVGTPELVMVGSFFVLGFGLGLGSQILVLIVQNEFPHSMVGVATAGNNFFRQIGSTLGTAIVGSVFTSRLAAFVGESIPVSDHISLSSLTPSVVEKLPEAVRQTVATGYCDALIPIFMVFVPVMLAAFIMMFFVQNHPLSDTVDNTGSNN